MILPQLMDAHNIAVPTTDGRWVSENHARIAEIIQDYDPTLYLAWIPPDKRTDPTDPPFAVIHMPLGKAPYVVKKFDQCDERILEYLWKSDTTKHSVLTDMEAHNAALEAIELKKKLESIEEGSDIAATIMRSPLNTFKHDGVTYR